MKKSLFSDIGRYPLCTLLRETMRKQRGSSPRGRKKLFYYSKRGKDKCTKTRHSFVKIAKMNSSSQPKSRNSTHPRASRTSRSAARLAAMQERTLKDRRESTSPPLAQDAARKQKFPSSRPATDLFTAATASQQ